MPGSRARSKALSWWIAVGSFASVAALCAWLGFYTTFNSYGEWDDEGYLLFSLKAFAHHGGLYTHIYSVFGPFYYEAFSTVFAWLPVTLDNGRVATLVVALLASLGFGVAIRMFTRSVLAGVATQAGTFFLLVLSFVDESMHPSILVWLLLAVALVALALVARGQRSVGCAVLGARVAAMVLTEVNTGVFATIALLFAGLALAPPIRGARLSACRRHHAVRGYAISAHRRGRRTCHRVLGGQVTRLSWRSQLLGSSSLPWIEEIRDSSTGETPTDSSSVAPSQVPSSSSSPSSLGRTPLISCVECSSTPRSTRTASPFLSPFD